jgi:hypothetical protein
VTLFRSTFFQAVNPEGITSPSPNLDPVGRREAGCVMNGVPLSSPAPTPAFLVRPPSATGTCDTSPTIQSGLVLRARPKFVPKPHWGSSPPHQPTTEQGKGQCFGQIRPRHTHCSSFLTTKTEAPADSMSSACSGGDQHGQIFSAQGRSREGPPRRSTAKDQSRQHR